MQQHSWMIGREFKLKKAVLFYFGNSIARQAQPGETVKVIWAGHRGHVGITSNNNDGSPDFDRVRVDPLDHLDFTPPD